MWPRHTSDQKPLDDTEHARIEYFTRETIRLGPLSTTRKQPIII